MNLCSFWFLPLLLLLTGCVQDNSYPLPGAGPHVPSAHQKERRLAAARAEGTRLYGAEKGARYAEWYAKGYAAGTESAAKAAEAAKTNPMRISFLGPSMIIIENAENAYLEKAYRRGDEDALTDARR